MTRPFAHLPTSWAPSSRNGRTRASLRKYEASALSPSRIGRGGEERAGVGPAGRGRRGGFGGRVGRGFTLIEMTVVIAILLLMAAYIVPNAVAFLKSRTTQDLEASVARLPAEARNEAVGKQVPVHLRLDGTQIMMEDAPVDGQTTAVKHVDLGSNLTVEVMQLNGQTSDTGSWVWTAYPDGTTDKGGIQFGDGSTSKSLVFGANGGTRWVDGVLPDQSLDQWPAGSLQTRS